jgi:hypothetical protein
MPPWCHGIGTQRASIARFPFPERTHLGQSEEAAARVGDGLRDVGESGVCRRRRQPTIHPNKVVILGPPSAKATATFNGT